MQKGYDPVPLVTNSSTLALNKLNAYTELYMQIWSQNLTTLFFLLVKKIFSSCDVAGRLGNRTLPFSQHKNNCGLLLFDFANRFLIHIFTLQNPQIVSIFPQSHHPRADASLSLNNCNASLPKEGCAHAAVCCMVHHSRHRRLLRYCGVSNGSADSIRYLAHRSLYRRLRRSRVDSDMFWLNFAKTLICETRFSKE